MNTLTFYLAGPLFTAAERAHNILLAQLIENLGHTAILPQVRAAGFLKSGTFSLRAMVEDCMNQCSNPGTIFVGNLDGPETDSGTAVEFGIAHSRGLRSILYRTDFRTDAVKEIGVNGMFQLADDILFLPAYFTDAKDEQEFYLNLARTIVETARRE